MRRVTRIGIGVSAMLFAAAMVVQPVESHKPITSKYTYNEDVFPVFRDRCGRCHVTGGVGPMSLMTYKDAYPWAESIRAELLAETMPPWHGDQGFARGISLHTILSPRELDVLLTWATGGTPQGSAANAPGPVALDTGWRLGKPDLEIPVPEFVLPADLAEAKRDFVVSTGLTRERRLKSVEFKPGNPAMVRHAVVAVDEPAGGNGRIRHAVAEWTPGNGPLPSKLDRLKPGVRLIVMVQYKRTWSYEGQPMADRSTIGLTFLETR